VNSEKQLVTQDGWPVLGRNGPITVQNPPTVRISEDGQVFDGNNQVDQLNLVQFPANSLKKVKNGYFGPVTQDVQPEKAENCTVRQGALEGPNFNPVEEMARMVETMRNFESYQKTMQSSENLDSELISKTSG